MEQHLRHFIDALNNDVSYDYIACNYNLFSHYELADIIKECLYAMNEKQKKQVAVELAENWFEN